MQIRLTLRGNYLHLALCFKAFRV